MVLIWLRIIDHVLWIVLVSDNARWWSYDKSIAETTSASFACGSWARSAGKSHPAQQYMNLASIFEPAENFTLKVSFLPKPGFEYLLRFLANRLPVAPALSVRNLPTSFAFVLLADAALPAGALLALGRYARLKLFCSVMVYIHRKKKKDSPINYASGFT